MDRVNEGTTAYLTVSFLDKAGAASAPSAVSYRIDCLTSGAQIKDDTSASASASVEITLSAADNALQSQARARERRRVTVTGTYGAADAVVDQYDYEIVNLGAAP